VAIPTFSGAPNPKDVCPTQIGNDHHKKKQNGACKPEIEIASDRIRNKIYVKFQRLYVYFRGRPDSKNICPTQIDNDYWKKNKMAYVDRK